jgi:hypothetical protein
VSIKWEPSSHRPTDWQTWEEIVAEAGAREVVLAWRSEHSLWYVAKAEGLLKLEPVGNGQFATRSPPDLRAAVRTALLAKKKPVSPD